MSGRRAAKPEAYAEAAALAHLHAEIEAGLRRDEDVLDTWYSLRAVAVLDAGLDAGVPAESNPALDLYLPSSVLVTGFDIIFFWVARMVMMTWHITGQHAVPRRLRARPDPRQRRPEDERSRRATCSTRSTSSTASASTSW
ncbi:MAG: class I tRNA ligase family protein [Chromatiales bacterium]|nr:class I tRNA ligase family protein [Chromatiales bacterium]